MYRKIIEDSSLTTEQMGMKLIHEALAHFSGREEIPEKLKNEEIDTVEQLLLCLKQEVFPEGAYGMDDDDEQQLQPMELSSQLKIFIFITEQ
ncbi:MAG: hypothetical protein PUG54_11740, partial [Firmicutes bacterium]|nr:hypothetical protein [Bacillota bacterium]